MLVSGDGWFNVCIAQRERHGYSIAHMGLCVTRFPIYYVMSVSHTNFSFWDTIYFLLLLLGHGMEVICVATVYTKELFCGKKKSAIYLVLNGI